MRWIIAVTLLIAVTCMPRPVAAGETVLIQLNESASTMKSIVTLSDIASIEGGDPWVRRQIRELDITELESAPSSDTVQQSQIALRLQLAGIVRGQYQLTGASETAITREHAQLNDQVVIEALRTPLATVWNVDPDSIRIRLTQPLARTLHSIPETSEIRLEPFVRDTLLPGRSRISIGVYDGDDLAHTFSVSVDTSIRRRIAIARGRVRPQHVLTAEDIQIEQREMTGRDALKIPDVVINQMAARWLRSGQVIRSSDIYRPGTGSAAQLIVRRNSVVRLVARKNGLRVTVRGATLLRDSRVGESVPAVNPTSKKTVVGRLVSPTEVEVPF